MLEPNDALAKDIIERLIAIVPRILEYAWHKDECRGGTDHWVDGKVVGWNSCDCGYEALLKELDELNAKERRLVREHENMEKFWRELRKYKNAVGVGGDNLEEMLETIARMQRAITKPWLKVAGKKLIETRAGRRKRT